MPYGDGTGPRGEGPMSGRGAGYCSGNRSAINNPISVRRWFNFNWLGWGRNAVQNTGQGSGLGTGRGRGSRRNAGYRARW